MTFAERLNVLQIQNVQMIRPVEMRNVWTHVIALQMRYALLVITEDTVLVLQAIPEIHIKEAVPKYLKLYPT